MGKHDAKGRSKDHRPQYVKLHHALLNTPAFRSLSVGARSLLIEIYLRYNGYNNGDIMLSQRQAGEALGKTDNRTLKRYFDELIDRGFIKLRLKGSFGNKVNIASHWIITEHDYANKPATRDFLRWRPARETNVREGSLQRPDRKIPSGGVKSLLRDWPVEWNDPATSSAAQV